MKSDAEIIASLGFGSTFLRRRPRTTPARPIVKGDRLWTNGDNLHGREARIHGGPCDGLRVVVRYVDGRYRHPDLFDLTGYAFDAAVWEFRWDR